MLCDPVDRPDPRLIDALENPRDRIFVVKLEKDLVAFIEDKRFSGSSWSATPVR
jgi:hypothetical protein